MLTEQQIVDNWNKFLELIETEFPDRASALLAMYKELEDRIVSMPASGVEHYHNAFPGGYVDHIIRVHKCAMELYELWTKMGVDISGFTKEELVFAAFHHDLGKVGFPGNGNEIYIFNNSEWHRKHQGKIYTHNPNNPFTMVPDLSLYLLQHYNIPVTWNEYLAIKIHDGLYDDANKPYFISRTADAKLKNCLPLIMHHADHMASIIEYDRWKVTNGSVPVTSNSNATVKSSIKKTTTPLADDNLKKAFDDLFN